PRCAARRAELDGNALRQRTEPVARGRQSPLLRATRVEGERMRVTVFGATGLLPLLVSDHELVAVSRSARAAETIRRSATRTSVRWVEGDASCADDVAHAIE